MKWTAAECKALNDHLKQLEIGSVNAEKFPKSETKNALLKWYATAIQGLEAVIAEHCPPK
jgi:hypothetical protein